METSERDLELGVYDERFQDPLAAADYLESLRWPNGPVCPHCGEALELFEDASSGESPLQKMGLPLLGRVPFDRRIASCADHGRSFVDEHPLTPAAQAFRIITESLQQHIESRRTS